MSFNCKILSDNYRLLATHGLLKVRVYRKPCISTLPVIKYFRRFEIRARPAGLLRVSKILFTDVIFADGFFHLYYAFLERFSLVKNVA